jgi:hypothetical protein
VGQVAEVTQPARGAMPAGPSRRQLLTRGGVLVAAVYATPVVSVLSMTAAHAQEASGAPTNVLDTVADRQAPQGGVPRGAVTRGPVTRRDSTGVARTGEPASLPFTGGEHQAPMLVASALVATGAVMTAAAAKRSLQAPEPPRQ